MDTAPDKDTPEVEELLLAWDASYKKGLLTFWLLLLLHGRESYAFEMTRLVAEASQSTITADENSIYRALNRFEGLGIVASAWHESDLGPPRRYYHLTGTGLELLRAFIRRNILVFQSKEVAGRIKSVMDGATSARG
jgi:DNA-binding PadR family transcriptional regulator